MYASNVKERDVVEFANCWHIHVNYVHICGETYFKNKLLSSGLFNRFNITLVQYRIKLNGTKTGADRCLTTGLMGSAGNLGSFDRVN